ncbi:MULTISPECIES: RHS repeat domain-containing protein [unclassified Treponema]|uniref:RHS repeat domain-containing protein n=1 Tax=unclassified Treponema TaxID=2638727 RepID=UPI0020A57A81|nr:MULTISPECIES: RHS repeat-associated core domain-containing protein [unclassified Treponema]
MKPKLRICSQPNYLIFRTAIEREQKQFIKIAFAVHLSAVISAERYRSDSVALKSAVFNFVFFIMLKNKIEQSAKIKLLLNKIILPEVFPLTVGSGKTMAFENRHDGCKEREKINRRRTICTLRINFFEATPQTACIFSKETVKNGNQVYSIKEYEIDTAPHARIKKETTTIRENYNEIKTESEYDYDKYGNVTKLYDKGEVTNTNDDIIAEITYWKGASEEKYFKAHPEKIQVLHGKTGTLLRKREGAYDSRTGTLTELKQYTSHGAYLVNRIEWTEEGNIKAVTSPTGKKAEYKYLDGIYPIEIKEISSKGDKSYTSTIKWNTALGVKVEETDSAGNFMTYSYDNFGRVTEVRSPYDFERDKDTEKIIGPGKTPYAKYTYITPKDSFWYTVTENKISTEADDTAVMKTIVTHDGLGRISCTAKEGEVYIEGTADSTQTGWNISSAINYDEAGRKIEEGMPFFYGGDLENNLKTISSYQGVEQFYELNDFTKIRNGTKYEYDDIDRNILTTLPDGHKQKTEYSIESSLQITKTTDPLENVSISKKDARGNIREVERLDKNNTILTKARYEYSVLGEMLRAYDAKNNLLSVSYDLLGRRTALESKDTGKKEWIYDDKGRLQAETDSVLKNKAAEIRYEYDGFDRIIKTDYPFSRDIEYKYGAPGQNGAGQIIYKKDETGETRYRYGYLNEVTSETRTINRYGAGSSPETASFEYRSDYLGRMQSMKYPDGETITYTYDKGGQLSGVSGVKTSSKGTAEYSYVDKILYDEHAQRVYIKYGNGVETRYKYDEKRRWLDTIETKNNQTQDVFQKIKYSFDPVGNVLGYNNDASTYETKQTYSYDNLYQLISVEGTSNQYKAKKSSGTTPVSIAKYRQTFAFDGIGNMKEKLSTTNIPGAQGNSYPKAELDYSLDYEYDPAYAHRLIRAGNRYYRYDANGNITAEKDGPFTDEEEFVFTYSYFEEQDVYGADYGFGLDAPKETEQSNPQDLFAYRRNYTWNERNLLTKSSDRNFTVHYRYGEDGQRALKYTDEGRSETLYFNNFFTIHIPTQDQNNPQGLRVHKHIFVGNSRLVTAMTHTDNQGDNEEQKAKRYYYHSDHLGSAQFVTDWKGRQYEHIEYTPYGELWIEEVAAGLDKLPFRFTGKELDEETGLYYYGARYLDPKYSRWLSGDPALNDYIPSPGTDPAKLAGMGGVYNTVNLHVYHYAGNNPVKYTDPDGKQTATAILNAKWKCLVQNLNQYIEMKHQVQDKIIKINHEINRKKGEIYDIAFNSVYKEINDFVNFYDIFDNSINAAMSNSGSFNMMLIAFFINIDVDALSGYLVDAYYAENMQTTGNEVNTSIFTKLMEIREMKAINASNKAELDNIEIEIADIKKKINELKLGDY